MAANQLRRAVVVIAGAVAVVASALSAPASAAPPVAVAPPPTPVAARPAGAPVTPASALPDRWWTSSDLVAAGSGDSGGFHVTVARAAKEFAWEPLATIRPEGLVADSWTGYTCLTGSGRYVVAVVAPRSFANSPLLRDRGALAYAVSTVDGTVRPLVGGVALKYYSPGCGQGDAAVLTRHLGNDQAGTQLVRVDAATAGVVAQPVVGGQLTSAVPDGADGFLAARGTDLVGVTAHGQVGVRGHAAGQLFDLVDGAGGVAALAAAGGGRAQVVRLEQGGLRVLGAGDLHHTRLLSGRQGRGVVVSSGPVGSWTAGPRRIVDASLATASPELVATSLDGGLLAARRAGTPQGDLERWASRDRAWLPRQPVPAAGTTPRTPLPPTVFALSATTAARSSAATPASAGVVAAPLVAPTPTCSVPRNSPTAQVPQPGSGQVERAVDLAVTGRLSDTRPANYLNMGLAAYTPSTDFPPHTLSGPIAGTVPAQVYLGVLAQESNFQQASFHALPGLSGNPLVADYYGAAGTLSVIDYANADCGYGIGQVTTGMRAADTTPYSANGKKKIAVDYEENIAAGLQILQDKWNALMTANITINNKDPKYIENWYFAVWAYNTGIQPDAKHGNTTGCTPSTTCTDSGGNWGLGWANNPINPDYPPGRSEFLLNTYADAATPGSWPYQERVMGWIDRPQLDFQGNAKYILPSYSAAGPVALGRPVLNIPARTAFCSAANKCNAADPAKQYCSLSDPASALFDHCWWHNAVTLVDCTTVCATQTLRFAVGSADPGVVNPHPADCNSRLPSSAVIVDDLANPAQNIAGCTTRNWTQAGTFALTEGTDAAGVPLAEIDTHQIGAGFGGHLYFAHNRLASDTAHLVTGTWTVALPAHLYNVFVHVPSTGGTTTYAHYKITAADGSVFDRPIDQHTNEDQWASAGYFSLGANAKVSLNNVTEDKNLGTHDVAYDAVAFVPVSGTFEHHTFDAVAVFDRNTNLDTGTPSVFNTPVRDRTTLFNWAKERTTGGPPWNNLTGATVKGILQWPTCAPSAVIGTCVGSATRAAVQAWSNDVVAAGTSTTGTVTEATWMGFANTRPSSTTPPATAFAGDLDYKIKTHVDVSFAIGTDGKIVPGSESANVTYRTGDTHIAPFVTAFVAGTVADYGAFGVRQPDLSFTMNDANLYSGDGTFVPNPLVSGETPGRAYMFHTSAPVVDATRSCVGIKGVSGGSIGYRPLDAQSSTGAAADAWVAQLKAAVTAGKAPPQVADTAVEIRDLFFRSLNTAPWSAGGSLFNLAPPIWHNLGASFCTGGRLASAQAVANPDMPGVQPVYQSYMPDLYLYFDNRMVTGSGAAATGPVQNGNFHNFSNIPGVNSIGGNAYDKCDITARGNGGNPWNISVPPLTNSDPDTQPKFIYECDDHSFWDSTFGA